MLKYEEVRGKGKYENLLLLEPDKSEVANFSLKSDHPKEKIESALKSEPRLKTKAPVIAGALSRLKKEAQPAFDVDVRINENDKDLIINCRVNGPNVDLDSLEIDGLKNVESDKVLGMNEIKITL